MDKRLGRHEEMEGSIKNVLVILLRRGLLDIDLLELGYTGSFKNGDGEFVLSFEFDDYGNVSSIELGEAVG